MQWPRQCSFNMRYRFRTNASALSLGTLVTLAAACGGGGPPRKVTVSQGSTLRSTADSLHAAGLLRFPSMFRMYVKFTGHDRQLKPGTYMIQPGASWSSMLATLTEGRGVLPTHRWRGHIARH